MRVIKVRAWDREEKRMVYNLEWIWCGSAKSVRYVYMLFTGLKDKNNREIYDGDILMYPDKRRRKKVVVEYGIWYCEEYGTYVGFRVDEDYRNMVVVGNIYENPELIGKR